eukprot:CAMPEP_0198683634 /NCGR_PEP_ID=MMETSP1468-20131203/10955_1 /TAXON_ID=1461545 /ORGANISM="Mantoniella sp, Strain CCMP1436" /LENGTH=259 /DNA_ID=CAMNT_0044427797 /DNA_START=69 /DNA_END=847 /DNA_ORIENTATION=+
MIVGSTCFLVMIMLANFAMWKATLAMRTARRAIVADIIQLLRLQVENEIGLMAHQFVQTVQPDGSEALARRCPEEDQSPGLDGNLPPLRNFSCSQDESQRGGYPPVSNTRSTLEIENGDSLNTASRAGTGLTRVWTGPTRTQLRLPTPLPRHHDYIPDLLTYMARRNFDGSMLPADIDAPDALDPTSYNHMSYQQLLMVQFLLNERVEQQQILEGVDSEQAGARESIENLDGDGGRGVGTRHRGDSAGEGGAHFGGVAA